MSSDHHSSLQPYHPTTFLERGAAVPFTTPLLGGTRARPTEKRGMELIVPSPSGGQGVYIMPWTSVATLCRPTLHDQEFNGRIASLRSITPSVIRRIARELAAEGLAGEDAMEAAQLAADNDRDDRVITNYKLLMALIEQVGECSGDGSPAPVMPDQAEQARLTVAKAALRLCQSTDWTAAALEALADVMTNIGVGSTGIVGRVPRILDMLRQTRTEIFEWGKSRGDGDQWSYADMFCSVADLTLSRSDPILAQARALADNMLGLLKAWATDPDAVVGLSSRPEWLLDGWEQICLVWNHAGDDAGRRAALLEIVEYIPILPREVNEWCDMLSEVDNAIRFRRFVRFNEDWRTGAMILDLIERNERVRAASC